MNCLCILMGLLIVILGLFAERCHLFWRFGVQVIFRLVLSNRVLCFITLDVAISLLDDLRSVSFVGLHFGFEVLCLFEALLPCGLHLLLKVLANLKIFNFFIEDLLNKYLVNVLVVQFDDLLVDGFAIVICHLIHHVVTLYLVGLKDLQDVLLLDDDHFLRIDIIRVHIIDVIPSTIKDFLVATLA